MSSSQDDFQDDDRLLATSPDDDVELTTIGSDDELSDTERATNATSVPGWMYTKLLRQRTLMYTAIVLLSIVTIGVLATYTLDGELFENLVTDPTDTGSLYGNETFNESIARSVIEDMDRTADPCTDPYQYFCGGYLKRTKLQPDESKRQRSFTAVSELNDARIARMLSSTDYPELYAFSQACHRVPTSEYTQLKDISDAVRDISSIGEFLALPLDVGLAGLSAQPFLELGLNVDPKQPERYVLDIMPGERLIPHVFHDSLQSDHWFNVDVIDWLAEMWSAGPLPALQRDAYSKILDLDIALAALQTIGANSESSHPLEYNTHDTDYLLDEYPAVRTLCSSIPEVRRYTVQNPEYLLNVTNIMHATSTATLQNYALTMIFKSNFRMLGQRQIDAVQRYDTLLYNTTELSRNDYCVQLAKSTLATPLSYYYVRDYGNAERKAAVEEIFDAIRLQFIDRLLHVPWMDDETRAAATKKLVLMRHQIAYSSDLAAEVANSTQPPQHLDAWDADGITTTVLRGVMQHRAASWYAVLLLLNSSDATVDRDAWLMQPYTVNAYYSQSSNGIVLPDAILQPPFFSEFAPHAYNYGALGVVVGHELTHSLDNTGSLYDATGVLRDWWSAKSREEFMLAESCISRHFGQFYVSDAKNQPHYVDGNLVLGEATADAGGVRLARDALHHQPRALQSRGVLQTYNMTSDQLYYTGFAQVWCSVAREQYKIDLIDTDPHPPARFRVEGTLLSDAHYLETFQCGQEATTKASDEQCEVW